MNKQLLIRIVVLSCVCVGLGLAPATSAAPRPGRHYTNFLDSIQLAVSNQLDTAELTRESSNALVRARNTLNGNSRTLSSDLLQLQNASGTLERAFPETNEVLVTGAEASYLLFFTEAQAQQTRLLADVALITNGAPRALSNQLVQISNAMANASIETDPVSQRSRALRQALSKIQVGNTLAARSIKAPASLEGKSVQFTTGRGRNTQRQTLSADLYNQPTDGGWVYSRTNSNTGTITVQGAGANPGEIIFVDYLMTFQTTTTGRFTSEDSAFGTNGTFRVFTPRRR